MEWNRIVSGLTEAATLAMNNNDWTPVRTLLEITMAMDSVEYTQLQQIHANDNIIEESCSRGFDELVSVFLKSGFKANYMVDKWTGITMLHRATKEGHLSLVNLLLNVGADIDCKMYNGKTPLFCAVQGGNLEVVKHLISAGADINTCDKDWKTLLDAAYHYNTVTEEMLQLLLDSGCDPNKCYSYCPLYMAARSNNLKCVKMLLEAGAHVNGTCTDDIPLHEAAVNGFIPIMELLLKYGADINARDNYGDTALHEAVQCWELQSVEFLIERGSLIDSVTEFPETPLLSSIDYRKFDIAILLINSGADPNLPIHDTVLHAAVRVSAPIHMIEHLLEHGASVTAVYFNNTALQYVIFYSEYSSDEKLQVAKLLLIYGSDHYVQDDQGNTLLYWACEMGDMELAEYLINYGLNVDAKNREGKKPCDIAREKGHTNIVKTIIHYHCNKYTNF